MALLDVVIFPDPVLHQISAPVEEVGQKIRVLLENMAQTMYHAPGIGLAAPQVGVLKRALVIDVSLTEENAPRNLYQLINPEITASSGEIEYEEGCLSIPLYTQKMKRASHVTVKAMNEKGEQIAIEAEGLLAICLQHEIDHLDGKLIIDKASKFKQKRYLEKLKKLGKEH